MNAPQSTTPLSRGRPRSPSSRVLVIGGGLAGLFTALRLAPLPATILCPRALGEGASSAWAQGGIAAAIGEGDAPERHAADTLAAGAGLSEPAVATILANEAPERIEDLLRYGVPFDRDLEGKLRLSQEAAHGARRIVRVNGDRAGKAVMAALIAAVAATPSITVYDDAEAIDLVQRDGRVIGVYARRIGMPQRATFLSARAVVLATGGTGHLYRVTTNPEEACGSGLAIAARAGAVIADPEFVQFHPTALDAGKDPAPLLSEAIRGDGALLINSHEERFLTAAHPKAELAPRDIVARAVHREIASGRGAFLDCRHLNLEGSFPTAFEACKSVGLDPAERPIPVAPAAHYHMGGVLTDIRGRTTLTGLWACGEVASTGVHGANRLASNSLLEAVVFAARVAADMADEATHLGALGSAGVPESIDLPNDAPPRRGACVRRLREVMAMHVGVERSEASLKAALFSLGELDDPLSPIKFQNMLASAVLIAAAALKRRESRGAHFRIDCRQLESHVRHSYLTLRQAKAILEKTAGGAPGKRGAESSRLRHRKPETIHL